MAFSVRERRQSMTGRHCFRFRFPVTAFSVTAFSVTAFSV